jgi:glycosyltransferase involved in cell wall biosynthesis
MTHPLITIGITCYNAADTIVRAIEGALHQDYPNFEILVIDDCSKDKSFDVLKDCADRIPERLRIFRNEKNLGVAGTRNRIIEEARGEFIAFFDDDDDCSPARLSIQYDRITKYEQDIGVDKILCFGSGKKIYPNGYAVHFLAVGSAPRIPVGDDMVRYHLMMDRPPDVFYGSGTPSCSMMARKSVFELVGGFDANFRRIEDSDICIRLGMAGVHFIGCPEEIIFQYASDGGDKNAQAGYDAEARLIEKYKDYLEEKGLYTYAKDWAKVRFYHFSGERRRVILQVVKMALKYPMLTLRRLLRAAPKRLAHEWRMKRDRAK